MTRLSRIARTVSQWVVRGASIVAGVVIEYRQVVGPHAQLLLIGLGLLFISVPPTLWFDKLAQLTDAVQHQQNSPTPPAGELEPQRRASDTPEPEQKPKS